jgi:hypothetical protein
MSLDLEKIVLEIREVLENKRNELGLTFVEENHIYYMKDKNGVVRNNFPSVSKVLKKFYEGFDSEGIAYKKAEGDLVVMENLLSEWKEAGEKASNMGSRTHFYLESETIKRYGDYKEVRKPIFECDLVQEITSDNMIKAGKKYLDLCEQRNLFLLDTEMVLGHPDLGYTGQPDKTWITLNSDGTEIGFLITDWKTNKEKNFQTNKFTKPMYEPFNEYPNNSLGHYFLQLPFYGKLLLKMLEGTKFENMRLYGCIVVLLKDDGTFEEFRVPKKIINTIMDMDMGLYLG